MCVLHVLQTPLLLVHQVRPHFGFLLPAPGSRCPAACQARTRTEESARSPARSPRILDVPSAARSVGENFAAQNHALISQSVIHHVDLPWPARDPAQPARARRAAARAPRCDQRVHRRAPLRHTDLVRPHLEARLMNINLQTNPTSPSVVICGLPWSRFTTFLCALHTTALPH